MRIYNIIIATLFIVPISCKRIYPDQKANENEEKSINQIKSNYDSLIYKVKNRGDIEAYDELFYSFMDANETERTDSVMKYSKIMAEKFNYEGAYLDYLKAFCKKNNLDIDYSDYSKINLKLLEGKSKEEAIVWLNKMLENKVITKKEYEKVIK